ncbi:MAG TPA: chemotaxis-specific protein-glutamate methyltransferase CheB [Polyangiaceae bacterium]|nr:chemotaxis-specific protein-glutamate methyltransferase CheB [Polyangiaceae bacterium]
MLKHRVAKNKKLIRIVIADDSVVTRELLRRVFDAQPDMIVVGMAATGDETVRLVQRLRPDLVTMDVAMPGIDGVHATRRIMASLPTPIAIVTARPMEAGHETMFRAMAAGAVDVIANPGFEVFEADGEKREHFVSQLRNVANVGVGGLGGRAGYESKHAEARLTAPPSAQGPSSSTSASLIAIGASTGGPPCIREILGMLDPVHSPPVIITQHLSPQFIPGFAEWLASTISLPVRIARSGALLVRGQVFVAPGDQHLEVIDDGAGGVVSTSPVHHQRPSVDVMFRSVAKAYGSRGVGILLTGMGSDGAEGLRVMRDSGSLTIAQDEASSLVYGMPAAACRLDAVQLSVSPFHIGRLLTRIRFAGADPRVDRKR